MKKLGLFLFGVCLGCSGGTNNTAVLPTSVPVVAEPNYKAQITARVVKNVASNAFGNLSLSPSCVKLGPLAHGKSRTAVVAARVLSNAGDCEDVGVASEVLWIFSQGVGQSTWNEDYVGDMPDCWEGTPEDLAEAISETSEIPLCPQRIGIPQKEPW